jgi:hypothetical protein
MGEHETREEDALVEHAADGHAVYDGLQYRFVNPFQQIVFYIWDGSESAHAAGVWSFIIVKDTFVVAGGR